MPLLGSVNAGIYRNQDVIPWPGQETAQSGRSGPPRADTPLMRLGIEQEKEQAINAIFQKHGEDYDGAVAEVMNIDPETGQKLAGLIADGRKKGAEQHKAETESSLKNLEMVGHGLEMAIQDPTQYPKLLEFVAKQPGGSEYLKFAPDPADPELVPKLKALLPAVLGPKDFLKVTADAAQDYIDGDKQLAAAKTLAAAVTPEQRQIADKWLKDGGLKDFSQMWPDAASAAAARDAMLEQKAKEKPAAADDKPEKLIAQTTGGLTGAAGLELAQYMKANGITDPLDPRLTGVINKIRAQEKQAVTIVNPGGGEKKRGVTAGDTNKIAEYNTALSDLDILEKTIGPGATGIAASAGAALPNWATNLTGWGTGAKSRQATIDLVKQVIGKSLEGGVLRKEDEIKYAKILPTISDPEDVVRTKIAGLRAAIQQKREEHFSALEDAGYDVSKFRARQESAKPKTGPGPKADPLGIR